MAQTKETVKNYLLKQYNLDKPGSFDEAVNNLLEWIKKQEHFTRKDFPKEYLEKLIVCNKGSLERTKNRLDTLCSMRTLSPQLFKDYDLKTDLKDMDVVFDSIMPNLTKDYEKVFVIKQISQNLSPTFINTTTAYLFMIVEYIISRDYFDGVVVVIDYTDTNLKNLLSLFGFTEIQQLFSIIMGGYGLRINALHFITPSKLVEVLVGLLKQFFNTKMGSRIHVHSSIDTIKNFVPVESLPKEYGGHEKSIYELHDDLVKDMRTEEFREYLRNMNQFRTNEKLRQKDKFNEQCMGLPGSFRTLVVD